jgi:hypothetical protein
MVRRGSTVRVRQRALQNPRSRGFSVQKNLRKTQRAVGMELFMELSRSREVRFVTCEGNLAGLACCMAPWLSNIATCFRVDLLCAEEEVEWGRCRRVPDPLAQFGEADLRTRKP